MSKRQQRQTVTFTDRGEPVEVELGAKTYTGYTKQAAHMHVPVETVIRKDLKPLIADLRRERREQAKKGTHQP